MNLPRLSAQGILAYPLGGYHDNEVPRPGPIHGPAGDATDGYRSRVYKQISNYFGMEHTGKTGHSDTIIQVFLLSLIVNRMNQED
jgi:hypothetical protein